MCEYSLRIIAVFSQNSSHGEASVARSISQMMDARALKISETMRARKLDNFKRWRDEMKRIGKIKSSYPALKKNGDLAELIGVTLGDGHVYKHDRCDSLRIVGDAAKMQFVNRSSDLIEAVFSKKPTIRQVTGSNAMTVTVYEREISKRLGIPHGSRAIFEYPLPDWITNNKRFTCRFLRGLYEAEGSLNHHLPTYTHKFSFANANPNLIRLVSELVSTLGFHPHISGRSVQVSRKEEVQKLTDLLQFRRY